MDLWHILLGVDAPPGARLLGVELDFRGLVSTAAVLLLVLLMLLASAGVVVLYFLERAKIGWARRLAMAGLRLAAINLLLLLLFLPVLVIEFEGRRSRAVVLLLDNSLSMSQADQRLSPQDRLRVAIAEDLSPPETAVHETVSLAEIPAQASAQPARRELVRSVLANERLRLWEAMAEAGPVRSFSFGQRLRSLESPGPAETGGLDFKKWLDGYRTEELQTALSDSIQEILLRNEDDLPTALVVMTDGRDNASKVALADAARECARWGVPLHCYGVGSSDIGNIQLIDVAAPATIFYDDTVAVPVRWRVQGFRSGTATITVQLGDLVERKQVSIREGDDFRDTFTLTPKKGPQPKREERRDLVVSVEYSGHESFTADNQLKRPVRLVDRKVKLLYVESSPRWEYKFLMAGLLRDRRVDPSFLLTNASPEALRSGPPYLPAFPATRDALFEFDLILLGDVPYGTDPTANGLTPERIGWLRDFVSEGGGLVLIAGRQHAPAAFHGTPLAEMLPVEFVPLKFGMNDEARPEPFQPELTRQGMRSEMLALADTQEESLQVWQNLPGWYWNYPITKLRPGAVPLLVHPRMRMDGQPMPIVATHYYGKGTVLFLGADETWRWRFNARERYFGRFWGQLIYQMGLPHLIGNPKRVQLALDRTENVLGKPGQVYARLFDAEFKPLQAERVAAILEPLDGRPGENSQQTIFLESVSGQPGEYRALLPHDAVGRFVFKVETPEPASVEYRVNYPPHHELETAGMAEQALREAAQLSGGQFYREEDLCRLAGQLKPQHTTFTIRQEVLPWNPLVLLLFVGLVSGEWILRKFANLS